MFFFNRHPGESWDPYHLAKHAGRILWIPAFAGMTLLSSLILTAPARADMTDESVVKLQALDKVSAHTVTFDAKVGATVKFGSLYIKPQACRKASPLDQPEDASFLQIWEVAPKTGQSHWVFSGWMFASSPALSPMDHPIYDVWVLDCVEGKTSTASLAPPLPTVPAAPKLALPVNPNAAPSPASIQTPATAVPPTTPPAPASDVADDHDGKDNNDQNTDDQDGDDQNNGAATPETVIPAATAPPPMDDSHHPVGDAPNPSSMY